jgi:hypothetical protein
METKITKVINGYVVFVQSNERHAETAKCTYVFNDFEDLCEHLKKWSDETKVQ